MPQKSSYASHLVGSGRHHLRVLFAVELMPSQCLMYLSPPAAQGSFDWMTKLSTGHGGSFYTRLKRDHEHQQCFASCNGPSKSLESRGEKAERDIFEVELLHHSSQVPPLFDKE